MSAYDFIVLIMVVGSAVIAIMSAVKGWPLWISNLLLSIVVALLIGGHLAVR